MIVDLFKILLPNTNSKPNFTFPNRAYFAGQPRQIITELAGQSSQIISFLAGHVPPNATLFQGDPLIHSQNIYIMQNLFHCEHIIFSKSLCLLIFQCVSALASETFLKESRILSECWNIVHFSIHNKPSFCSGSWDEIHATKKWQKKLH